MNIDRSDIISLVEGQILYKSMINLFSGWKAVRLINESNKQVWTVCFVICRVLA